jgi:hypothetical protein
MKGELASQGRTIQDQTAALAQATQQIEALRADVQQKVEASSSELQQKVEGARTELQQKVEGARTELQQKIADTSTKLTSEGAARERSVGLSLAANSLDTALQTGQPIEQMVATLRQLSQGDQVVDGVADTLEPMAAAGIPTMASLAQKLDGIEQGLAATPGEQPSDWLDRTRANLNNLIDLHPADQEAVPGQNAVRGARQALLLQDLPGAVAALKPLADGGNEAAKAWIDSANQRLAAVGAVDTLRQQLKTMLVRQG